MVRHSTFASTMLCLAFFVFGAFAIPSLSLRDGSSGNGLFAVTATRNVNHRVNGPLDYARALSKWSARLPGDLTRVATVAQGLSMYLPPLYSAENSAEDWSLSQ
jgi:hypothetical protein